MGHTRKPCSRCKKVKTLSEFRFDKRFKLGVRPECRACAAPGRRARSARQWRDIAGKAKRQNWFKRYAASPRGMVARITSATDARIKLKLQALSHYSEGKPKCNCCGEKHLVFLTIDHVKIKSGRAHRAAVTGGQGGTQFYRWLRNNNFPKGFQVLCFNCNFAKHVLGSCPHQHGKSKNHARTLPKTRQSVVPPRRSIRL